MVLRSDFLFSFSISTLEQPQETADANPWSSRRRYYYSRRRYIYSRRRYYNITDVVAITEEVILQKLLGLPRWMRHCQATFASLP